jgi:branched-chain amino acid transport system ATP-binding protein
VPVKALLCARFPACAADPGIALVREGRRVFRELTVKEDLEIGSHLASAKAARARILELVFKIFPSWRSAREQLAGTMSGGASS